MPNYIKDQSRSNDLFELHDVKPDGSDASYIRVKFKFSRHRTMIYDWWQSNFVNFWDSQTRKRSPKTLYYFKNNTKKIFRIKREALSPKNL